MQRCLRIFYEAAKTMCGKSETWAMRLRRPDTSRMAFFAFELLIDREVDLRSLPLSERQRDLVRLCKMGRKVVPCPLLVGPFPEGEAASRVVRALSARGHRFEAVDLEVLERHMPGLAKKQNVTAGGMQTSS